MKKLITYVFLLSVISLSGQKKYEKIMYEVPAGDTPDMTINVKDAVSTKAYTKFNLKLSNKSNEILIYKPEESALKANNKDYKASEKRLEVMQTESESRVINVNGSDFMIPSYSFVVDGVYKVSAKTNSLATADFQLPPSNNEFTTGNFSCQMIDLSKETDKTSVKFECRYTGNKIGVIIPARAAVKLPDGTEIANAKSKQTPEILMKGESLKFNMVWNRMEGGRATDMQKINMLIIWRNTFIESDAVKLDPVTLDFKIDESKSK